jgi:hypothetical protein
LRCLRVGQAVAGERRVGRDDRRHARLECDGDEIDKLAVREVRGDLEKHRHRARERGVRGHHAGEQGRERVGALQVAQALGVRR